MKSPVVVEHVQIFIFLLSTVPPQDDSSVSSEDMNAAEPTWVAAEQPPVPEPSPPNGDTVSNPAAAVKEEDGEASRSESCSDSLSGCFIYIRKWKVECRGYRLVLRRKQLASFLAD